MPVACSLVQDLPFTVHQEGSVLHLVLLREADLHPHLVRGDSVAWAWPHRGCALRLDWASQPRCSAMLSAWLFHVVEVLRPSDLILLQASVAVRDVLLAYHLPDQVRLHGGILTWA